MATIDFASKFNICKSGVCLKLLSYATEHLWKLVYLLRLSKYYVCPLADIDSLDMVDR